MLEATRFLPIARRQVSQRVPDPRKRRAFFNFCQIFFMFHSLYLKLPKLIFSSACDYHFWKVNPYMPYIINGKCMIFTLQTPKNPLRSEEQPSGAAFSAPNYGQFVLA
jgi:hypothetical protein